MVYQQAEASWLGSLEVGTLVEKRWMVRPREQVGLAPGRPLEQTQIMAEMEAIATGYGPVVGTAQSPQHDFFHLDVDANTAGWLTKHLSQPAFLNLRR